jgi:hypothetical protein
MLGTSSKLSLDGLPPSLPFASSMQECFHLLITPHPLPVLSKWITGLVCDCKDGVLCFTVFSLPSLKRTLVVGLNIRK